MVIVWVTTACTELYQVVKDSADDVRRLQMDVSSLIFGAHLLTIPLSPTLCFALSMSSYVTCMFSLSGLTRIQAALGSALPGTIIMIEAGTYTESLKTKVTRSTLVACFPLVWIEKVGCTCLRGLI